MIRTLILLGAAALFAGRAAAAVEGWTLALTWQPGYCAVESRTAGCDRDPVPRLVLHGLWPDGAGAFCTAESWADTDDPKAAWCGLPPVPLAPETRQRLRAAMPGIAACLDRHEWRKHGTCTGLTPEAYFDRAAALTDAANGLGIARVLREAGATVTLARLRDAAKADFGRSGAAAVVAICANRRGEPHLIELRFRLAAEGPSRFPAADSLRREARSVRQRCPDDRPIALKAAG
jgi:ribonuclease I